jgi:histidine triad (HIT) family protein
MKVKQLDAYLNLAVVGGDRFARRAMKRLLVHLARSPLAQSALGWLFAHMRFAIPVKRLHETPTLLAFHHPKPSYPVHILLVPKAPRASLADLTAEDAAFMVDLFATVARLVAEFDLDARGYRLIANGGAYQDVPLLHFHLISEAD